MKNSWSIEKSTPGQISLQDKIIFIFNEILSTSFRNLRDLWNLIKDKIIWYKKPGWFLESQTIFLFLWLLALADNLPFGREKPDENLSVRSGIYEKSVYFSLFLKAAARWGEKKCWPDTSNVLYSNYKSAADIVNLPSCEDTSAPPPPADQ